MSRFNQDVTVETVRRSSDRRGFVFEPLEGPFPENLKNVHVVVSRPGAVRGNHFHRKGTETLVVCGPARVCIRSAGQVSEFSIPADAIYRLVIPPKMSHAIENTAASDNLLVAFNTEAHDPAQPDAVADVLIPANDGAAQ